MTVTLICFIYTPLENYIMRHFGNEPTAIIQPMRFGFVIATEQDAESVELADRALRMLTNVDGEVERRLVPGTAETVLACRCFAELTSVDAVLVFLPKDENPSVLTATLEGLTDVVLDWNMPIVTTASYPNGAKLAEAAVAMVKMQIEMEAASEGKMVDTSVN